MELSDAVSCVGQAANMVWLPLKDVFNYCRNFEHNVKEVESLATTLEGHRGDIEAKRKQIEREGLQELTDEAENWLSYVNRLLDKYSNKLEGIRNYYRSSEHNTCPHPEDVYFRYKYSKLAQKLIDQIKSRIQHIPREICRSIPIDVATIRINQYLSFHVDSRTEILDKIVDKLTTDTQVYAVGLFGNALVGKTKMAKDVINNESVKREFDKRVIVDVNETPNKNEIQNQIIGKIAKNLEEFNAIDDVAYRAIMLQIHIHHIEDKKILIVFDGMWKRLNLQTLGIIPAKNCKVMVISRMKDVCEAMEVKEEDIFPLNPLTLQEAQSIFWRQIYQDRIEMLDHLTSGDYVSLGDKLLKNYCRGLPLAVVALAKMLKDKTLQQWHEFANDLKVKKDNEVFDSIWDKNLELLKDDKEKKMFFLLTCLFPRESRIPIHGLMSYAMGIDLLPWVDNLTQAITQANTWVHELISASLLEPDVEQNDKARQLVNVVVPRLVRKRAISLLAKEEQQFLVKSIPRWHTEEKCQNYTAISLMSGYDHSRLDGFYSNKLQILILDHSQPQNNFANPFFRGMGNLKVLVLKGMDLPQLPDSIGLYLKQLRLLHLESCKLGTMKFSYELVKLIVFSLRESELEEFPAQVMKKCDKLRLLDLSKCKIKNKGIPADVLCDLIHLEGLYAYDCFEDWATENHETGNGSEKSQYDLSDRDATARISELNNMNYLNVLEMKVRDPNQFPVNGDQFTKNLNQFRIHVGSYRQKTAPRVMEGLCRILEFQSIKASSISQYSCVRELLKKTEMLTLVKVQNLQQFIRDRFNFHSLQILEITKCSELQYFSHTPFKAPNLIDLKVVKCTNLKFFFETHDSSKHIGDDEIIGFPNLKVMMLQELKNLGAVLSESNCTTTNPDLQENEHQYQAFFHPKITFPKLEELELNDVGEFVKLWDVKCKEPNYISGFKKLNRITLWKCNKLEGLASFAIAATLELKELTIEECPNMKSVVTTEEEKEDEVHELFPSLEKVTLNQCDQLQFFITGNHNHQVLELPCLQSVEVNDCPVMQAFSTAILISPNLCDLSVASCANLNFFFDAFDPTDRAHIEYPKLKNMVLFNLQNLRTMLSESNCTTSNTDLQGKGHQYQAFFHRKITFPVLEKLDIESVGEIVTLWDFKCNETYYTSSFKNLKTIEILSCAKLESLASLAIAAALEQLKELTITDCPKIKSVIDKSENEASYQRLFPSLETITLESCLKLQFFIAGIRIHQGLEIPSLQTLKIRECPEMQAFASTIAPESNCPTSSSDLQGKGHQYQVFFHQKFRFPALEELELTHVGEITKLWDVKCKKKIYVSKFENLKRIVIRSCAKLEVLASFAIAAALYHLKEVTIVECRKMKSAVAKEKKEKELRQQQLFPSLEKVTLEQCPILEFFITGTQNQVLELSSLKALAITECPQMQAFSSTVLKAPKLPNSEYVQGSDT